MPSSNEHVTGERLGPMLRRLRLSAGMSEEDLARDLRERSGRDTVTRSEVWRWENEYEGRTPGPLWLPYLAAVLRAPVEVLRAARAVSKEKRRLRTPVMAEPADVLARFLPGDAPLAPLGTSVGRRVGLADAEALLQRVHGLRLADDVLAGGDLVGTVVRELRAVRELYNNTSHTEQTGQRLLVALGELAQLAGWVASDTGGRVDPEPLFRLGAQAARQTGDDALTAHLLGSWGYWTANNGNVRRGAELVGAAQAAAGEGVSLRARSLTGARVAWTAVLNRDQQLALRTIGAAMDQITTADPEEDAERQWLYWVNVAEQEVMEARVYTQLHRPLRAVPLLRKVLCGYDRTHAREYALYASWLATALLDANEPEEAADVARNVLQVSAAVPSSRAADRSKSLLASLRRHAAVPAVAEVLAFADV